jgi:Family of unknown function (DUF5706)
VTTIQPHQSSPEAAPGERGNQFGWRVHEAQQAWIASVDAKASIVLVVEVAVGGAAVHLLISDDQLARLGGAHLAVALLALVSLGFALGSALAVVFPRMARRRAPSYPPGLIYFGHLRGRAPATLAQELEQIDAPTERRQLAAQMEVTAQIAWQKHSWLQVSLVLVVIGSLALLGSLLLFPSSSPAPNPHQSIPAERTRRQFVEEAPAAPTFRFVIPQPQSAGRSTQPRPVGG